MTTKKPASAGRKPATQKSPTPRVVEGVKLLRLPLVPNKPAHPCAQFLGEEPNPGDVLEFTLVNDVTYRGVVSEATEAAGEVLVEFSAPLTVVPTK